MAFARAECSKGCTPDTASPPTMLSDGARLALRSCRVDDEMVLGSVVADRSRSVLKFETEALDPGIRPPNSRFLILDLRSSSSSQTVEGAVCDNAESDSGGDTSAPVVDAPGACTVFILSVSCALLSLDLSAALRWNNRARIVSSVSEYVGSVLPLCVLADGRSICMSVVRPGRLRNCKS